MGAGVITDQLVGVFKKAETAPPDRRKPSGDNSFEKTIRSALYALTHTGKEFESKSKNCRVGTCSLPHNKDARLFVVNGSPIFQLEYCGKLVDFRLESLNHEMTDDEKQLSVHALNTMFDLLEKREFKASLDQYGQLQVVTSNETSVNGQLFQFGVSEFVPRLERFLAEKKPEASSGFSM